MTFGSFNKFSSIVFLIRKLQSNFSLSSRSVSCLSSPPLSKPVSRDNWMQGYLHNVFEFPAIDSSLFTFCSHDFSTKLTIDSFRPCESSFLAASLFSLKAAPRREWSVVRFVEKSLSEQNCFRSVKRNRDCGKFKKNIMLEVPWYKSQLSRDIVT